VPAAHLPRGPVVGLHVGPGTGIAYVTRDLSSVRRDHGCSRRTLRRLARAAHRPVPGHDGGGLGEAGRDDTEAVFHLYFRENPFGGGYSVACGLATALEYLADFSFTAGDLDYLAGLKGDDGEPLLTADALDRLGELELSVDVDAIPEGSWYSRRAAAAHQRADRAVPAARDAAAQHHQLPDARRHQGSARGDRRTWRPCARIRLRRAQGVDGGVAASRAAYAGGCSATSNVLAGKLFGIRCAAPTRTRG